MEHKLGHGDCPACQRDNAIRIQEIATLRAINAQLLAALEQATLFIEGVFPEPSPLLKQELASCRNAIEAAKD